MTQITIGILSSIPALMIIHSLLLLYKNKSDRKAIYSSKKSISKMPLVNPANFLTQEQYFTQEELQVWKIKVEEIMAVSRPYLNPTLTLADLAKALQTNDITTSRVIYEGFQLCFYDFINAYRIDYLVQLSKNKDYQHYTTLGLAYEAGFNAKSTFYRVFKKHKKTTPAVYLKFIRERQSR